jgi:hypothetical protein
MTKNGNPILISLLNYMIQILNRDLLEMILRAKSPSLMKTSQVPLALKKLKSEFKKELIRSTLLLLEVMALMEPSTACFLRNSSL